MYNIILADKTILYPIGEWSIKNVLPYEFEDKTKAKINCDIFNERYPLDEQTFIVVETQTLANLLAFKK